MAKVSRAQELREIGNDYYKLADDDSFDEKQRLSQLSKAMEYYVQSAAEAERHSPPCEQDRASALKNLGRAQWKQIKLLLQSTPFDLNASLLTLKGLIISTNTALEIKDAHTKEWRNEMMSFLHQKLTEYQAEMDIRFIGTLRARIQASISQCFAVSHQYIYNLGAAVNLRLSELYFNESVKSFEGNDYKSCLEFVESSTRALLQREMFLDEKSQKDDQYQDLHRRLALQKSSCSGILKRMAADTILKRDEMKLRLDDYWMACDLYRESMLMTSGVDMENEAISCFKLGELFYNRIKLKKHAKVYYRQCLDIGEALKEAKPRVLQADWYTESEAMLEAMQQEAQINEDEEEQTKLAPILLELKPLIDKLQAKKTGAEPFINYIFEAHPPKKAGSTKPSTFTRADLSAVIKMYHPDSQPPEAGITWKVLCGEISKILNFYLEEIKGFS